MEIDNTFKLSGFVSEFPIVEVLQFLGMTHKNGKLRIIQENGHHELSLYFNEGDLVHAEGEELEGLQAFYHITKLKAGYFKFESGLKASQQTIDCPLSILLLDSQKRLDELKHLQSRLPHEDSVLYLVQEVAKVPPLTPQEWRVLSMINGRRSIKRISDKFDDELEAKNTILNLLLKGLINTFSDETAWKLLTPSIKSSGEINDQRPYPLRLRTNLLLKSINGKSTLMELMINLNINESDMLEDVRLLHETQWIVFPKTQEKLFARLKNEL